MVGNPTFVVLLLWCLVCCRAETTGSLRTLDNGLGEGFLVYGRENTMADYAVLKNDPVGGFPDQFTICDSLFVEYVTTTQLFLALYHDNGKPWVSYYIKEGQNVDDLTCLQ